MSVAAVATDVSEQVKARQASEASARQLRLLRMLYRYSLATWIWMRNTGLPIGLTRIGSTVKQQIY
ncbi:hypothetical protein AHMF7616_05282 [Adhaeribacter pallidiroseus]|uniref:Uncharacterized protein n=1 Tax=Adhaeribacter pallidiroseus TaxID=2072847 RepID=A0A369Q984_9BACT|nr:hypothetical protein [Adhaeribacter pallidiroseus]RDC58848.1 hypothetical protein AHMF7616_05282 [Adhaeribacter pallidiroseus]